MNLLIVEDEIRLLHGIKNNIPWLEHGINIVAAVSNGFEAFQITEQKKVDIILLDIRMPEMDGLTLAKMVIQNNPNIKIIILSGHDNFSYAQEAISIGIYQYLLKPAGDKTILETVLEAAKQIKLELMTQHNQSELNKKWDQNLPYLQERFYQNWILEGYEEWEVTEKGKELLLNLSSNRKYAIAVVDIDEGEVKNELTDENSQPLSLLDLVQDVLEENKCKVFNDSNLFTIIMFINDENNEDGKFLSKISQTITYLLAIIRKRLHISASAGISFITDYANQVPTCYQQAITALQKRVILGHNSIITYGLDTESKRKKDFSPIYLIKPNIETLIISGDAINAIKYLDTFIDESLQQISTMNDVKELILLIYHFFTNIIYERGWSINDVLKDDSLCFISSGKFKTNHQLKKWTQQIVERIITFAEEQKELNTNDLIMLALTQIDECLEVEEELTLQSVAEKLYINSSYLSRLFKQEVGKTFSDYLLDKKMKRAKDLLYRGSKVFDTAHLLGYKDVSYFTKVFKKYWGITPGEIKKGSAI